METSSRAQAPRWIFALAFSVALAAGSAAPLPGAEEVLLGKTRRAAILAISPEWQHQYDSYAPDPADLKSLEETPPGAALRVYFGSWCSDSRAGVPHLLKILDAGPPSHLKISYYAVDRMKKEPERLLREVDLKRVPTFVLLVRGQEIGRIVETPATTLEHDLALLIRKAQEAGAS